MGYKMNNGVLYRAAVEAEERILHKMNRFRQARSEVAARGLAFDSSADDARAIYVSAMEQMGVSASELRGLTSYDLQRMLKIMPARGSRARAPSMAFDANRKRDHLDEILADAPTPVNLTEW
jgi:hypothetical protein